MRQLVRKRGIIMVETRKEVRGRHGHAVGNGLIVSLIAMVPQGRRDCGEEGVEFRFASFGLDKFERFDRMKAFGQTLDLVGVEHRIGLQNAACLVALLARVRCLDLLGVALVEDRDGRLLALADLGAKRLGLVIRHPER